MLSYLKTLSPIAKLSLDLDLQGQNAVIVVIRRTIADQQEWKDSEKVLCSTRHKEDV